MLWLEDIESEDNIVVAKWHISEWAKTVCIKIDNLDKRLKTVEGVMEHGHHEAPVVTVVGSLTPEPEVADWDNEGDPGECPECGAPYQIVRPGKVQETCRCYEVHRLEEEVPELRRRLAEKPVGLLAEIEILRGEIAVYEKRRVERKAECGRLHSENDRLRAENVALRRDGTVLQVRMQKRIDENERLRAAAANWALVERMPLFMQLWPCGSASADRNWAVQEAPGRHIEFASSPEAALRAALGEGK